MIREIAAPVSPDNDRTRTVNIVSVGILSLGIVGKSRIDPRAQNKAMTYSTWGPVPPDNHARIVNAAGTAV